MENRGIETIIAELKKNPMFRLSLGSKELFHSNFLEFLWEYDMDDTKHGMFFKMLDEIDCKIERDDKFTYVLSREKENFDICIYHKEGRKICYDLIIENKVKSIPRKEQLMEYYKKTEGHRSPKMKLILLSLVEVFPDWSNIGDEKFKAEGGQWSIVNYKKLYKAIDMVYKTDNTNYITDYCNFIKQMHSLQGIILGNNFEDEEYYVRDELRSLEKVRLHDLYIKLRASNFLLLLEQELKKKEITNVVTIPSEKYKKYDDIRQNTDDDVTRVFLNYTIQSGNGMVAAYIYKKGNKGDKIIEVVIQGGQYRHGVNSPRYKTEHCEKSDKLSKLWNDVSNDEYMKQTVDKNLFNSSYDNKLSYCVYGDDYVYRYFKIDGKKVIQLIGMMVNDIKDVVNNEDLWKI